MSCDIKIWNVEQWTCGYIFLIWCMIPEPRQGIWIQGLSNLQLCRYESRDVGFSILTSMPGPQSARVRKGARTRDTNQQKSCCSRQ